MRDVIVVGAGGGGAVIAKELASRGLDVLLLEAGPRFADPEQDWTHFESDANNPASGYFRFGPADRSKPPWVRELAQSTLFVQLSGVGGTTNHYQGNSPRAAPGVFTDYDGADRNNYDTDHLFPFGYRELLPYYEWVEHTLPVANRADGTQGRDLLSRRATARSPRRDDQGHHARRVPAAAERDPATARQCRQDERSAPAGVPACSGMHVLWPLFARLLRAAGCADQSEGQAVHIGQLHSDGPDVRSLVARRESGHVDARMHSRRVSTRTRSRSRAVSHGASERPASSLPKKHT